MTNVTMYIPVPNAALLKAGCILRGKGIIFTDTPEEAEYLLYPVPTPLSAMADYSTEQTVIGGNLDFLNDSVTRLDLLKDPYYLCSNAAITAEAALGLILQNLKCAASDAKILILGWGRIGKCLTHQLHHLDADVTVYARKHEDRALLRALGYHYITAEALPGQLRSFHCVINTAPAKILTEADARRLRPECLKLDLASTLCLPGDGILHARGLPGKCKPDASGDLIARSILYHLGGE